MKLSIIVPILNEQDNLTALYTALRSELNSIGADYELLMVDDGSTDHSVDAVIGLRNDDPAVKLLSFSKNFGHQAALTAGLDYASGDAVITMDADLQHPPTMIRTLVERWKEGFEIVYTVRERSTAAGWFKDRLSTSFYSLFNRVAGIHLEAGAADFRLLDRKVVRSLGQMRERSRFLRGLISWVGFRATSVRYQVEPRHAGETKYTLTRMLRLALDALVSFSTTPLYAAVFLGLGISGLGFLYALYAVYSYFVTGDVIPGWSSLFVFLSIVSGVQLIVMGMLGLYIAKVFDEAKRRPLYILRRMEGFPTSDEGLEARSPFREQV